MLRFGLFHQETLATWCYKPGHTSSKLVALTAPFNQNLTTQIIVPKQGQIGRCLPIKIIWIEECAYT